LFERTTAPRMKPSTMPPMATPSATFHSGSPRRLATTARMMPIGPKMIGRMRIATTPQTMARIEKICGP
jgi:hypothetical protein